MTPPVLRALRQAAAIFILVAGTTLAGCATAPSDPEARAEYQRINDPFEPANRFVFALNRAIDAAIVKPLAALYREFTPKVLQEAIGNILANLRSPVVLANDVLQGEGKRAGHTLARFVVNSTVGLGGAVDVASEMGIPRHAEDFGQTLAVWGVPEGPYLVLPIFGPSNPRDTVGLVADFFTDPINWYAVNTGQEFITYSRAGATGIDVRARHMKELDDLERTSLDYYAAIRSLYRERRADEIRNGQKASDMPAPGLSGSSEPVPGALIAETSAPIPLAIEPKND
ncbi:MAG: VacJ family lipoprotein [Alphaproteobacteria bacterium]|nr:VacJ family lipoprotein [Alphaproteobacteria bacterium]MBM3951608.1 VacJ family lipoprotein [Rhodospirillales bacterium]